MRDLHKIHFFLFSILWILSYFAYPLAELFSIAEKVVNFAVYHSILLLNIIFLIISYGVLNNKIEPFSMPLFIICFIFLLQFIVSLFSNSVIEWLPTFCRYLLYITSFIIFYLGFKTSSIKISYLSVVISILSSILIFSGFYELFSGSVRFVNGAYRVSGNFTDHHLGFALSAFVNITYLQFISFKKFNFIRYLLLFLLIIVFVLSHSRLLLISLIFSSFFIRFYLKKQIIVKISYVFAGLLFSAFFLSVILYTDLLPRMKEMFVVSEIDSSSMYRLFIIQQSIMNLNFFEYFIGIGMGGFNNFFFEVTGDEGVAAHNDYLLMLIEGGIVSLILYIVFQYKVLRQILKRNLKNLDVRKLVFVLFFGVEIVGFLQNAHYFYQSEILVFISLSFFYANRQQENSLFSTK